MRYKVTYIDYNSDTKDVVLDASNWEECLDIFYKRHKDLDIIKIEKLKPKKYRVVYYAKSFYSTIVEAYSEVEAEEVFLHEGGTTPEYLEDEEDFIEDIEEIED